MARPARRHVEGGLVARGQVEAVGLRQLGINPAHVCARLGCVCARRACARASCVVCVAQCVCARGAEHGSVRGAEHGSVCVHAVVAVCGLRSYVCDRDRGVEDRGELVRASQ